MSSKRRLTDQQKMRQESYSSEQEGVWGLVLSHFGKTVSLIDKNNNIFECNLRQHVGALVVGDEVLWVVENNNNIIVKCLPRRQLLKRPDRYKGEKLIAANIDQALVVIPCDPEPDLYTLDRYLVALNYFNIKAIILFHKYDLAADSFNISGSQNKDSFVNLEDVINYYKNISYECYKTSVLDVSCDFNILKNSLENKKSILVGLSGAGKSSLLNFLTNSAKAIVGEMSQHNKKGKHTTSRTTLYLLGNNIINGCLIDSPGIRQFGLWNLTDEEVFAGFIELFLESANCKYRNCRHDETSSNCAVQKILLDTSNSGKFKLASLRLKHYFRILK